MHQTPNSISDLIDRWETIGAFADAIHCKYETARGMRVRNSIAPEHWDNVVAASIDKGVPGITLEWLHRQRIAA